MHDLTHCGTCYEYPFYNVIKRQSLKLQEHPLIVMECSVINDCYIGLGLGDNTYNTISLLKKRCKQFGGDFTLLWHNSHLITKNDKLMFEEIIKC
ncbi:MAG: hypothetical protein KAI79_08475 [Bacteroidales bacterium]|nr:hypothetical protein [Bacteroidales bacterium]